MSAKTDIQSLLEEIAAAHTFRHPGNFGRGVFEVVPSVHASGDEIHVSLPVNAQVKYPEACERVRAVRKAVGEALDAAGLSPYGVRYVLRRGKWQVWRTGYTHMGRFCTDGAKAAIRVPGMAFTGRAGNGGGRLVDAA